MRYTTYYEENETVRKDKYEQMKQAALTGRVFDTFHISKVP